ncbi:MAG: 50S ribosomal protein L17 [Chlamydiota bacterium]
MRHRKNTFKMGRTLSHRRCLIANMLKSLIDNGRIETTVEKAKELRRHADRMVTLAKKGTLASRRQAIAKMMIRYNHLDAKQARRAKNGEEQHVYNVDRRVISALFEDLGKRYADRDGGYTRIVRSANRAGDNAKKCIIEFV